MRLLSLAALMLVLALDHSMAQQRVETRGISAATKIEEILYGHLNELNGKFKMRATEVTFAPGAYLGVHHHVGPGIRYVLRGELSFTEGGQTPTYGAGDYFFETGNLAHTAENKTTEPLTVLFF